MLDFIKKLGVVKTSIVAITFIILLIFFITLILRSNHGKMVAIYNDLSVADKYEVIRLLNDIGASFVLNDDIIMVNNDKVRELRMFLASEGLPSNGSLTGYEIFNKQETFTTSSFTQNINLLRALEGELARTIMSFDQIKLARVHLVIAKRELFSKDKQNSKASVVLKMRNSNTLSKKEVTAIRRLVASAVSGLNIDDVTIVTTEGKSMTSISESDDEISFANHEYKLELERHIRDSIENLLAKSLGMKKVKAEVSIELDFSQLVIESEIFDPNNSVVRSSQTVEEQNNGTVNEGNVSVDNSIPNDNYENKQNSIKNYRIDETKNYEISKEKRQQIKKGPTIKQISVAVLIDGDYIKDSNTGQISYNAQDESTMEKLNTLISSAIGLNFERGDRLEVINMKFIDEVGDLDKVNDDTFINYLKSNFYPLLRVFLILLTVIIALIIIKTIISKILDYRNKDLLSLNKNSILDNNENKEPEDNTLITNEELENGVSQSITEMMERLNKIVLENSEGTVSLVRKWLNIK